MAGNIFTEIQYIQNNRHHFNALAHYILHDRQCNICFINIISITLFSIQGKKKTSSKILLQFLLLMKADCPFYTNNHFGVTPLKIKALGHRLKVQQKQERASGTPLPEG